jgi:hypothetical protein
MEILKHFFPLIVCVTCMAEAEVSTSWCQAHCGACDQILILSEFCCRVSVGRPLTRGRVCLLSITVSSNFPRSSFFFHFFFLFYTSQYIQYMQGLVSPGSVQQIMLRHLWPTLQQQSKHLNSRTPDRHQVLSLLNFLFNSRNLKKRCHLIHLGIDDKLLK